RPPSARRNSSPPPRPTTAPYPPSLHGALPISAGSCSCRESADPEALEQAVQRALRGHEGLRVRRPGEPQGCLVHRAGEQVRQGRSEEHTSELQSRENLVCRLLLEKQKHK